MIRKGYFLSQIAEIVPWVTKADIYGLSHMIHKPMELTKEDLREVELEYRKTGEPAVLKKIFGEPDQNKEGKSEAEQSSAIYLKHCDAPQHGLEQVGHTHGRMT